LKTLLQSLSFEILFFRSQKETDLDQFFTFFEKVSRINQENSQAKPKNITLVSICTRQVAKHDPTEFQPATQTETYVWPFFKKIPEFFRKTPKGISKNSKLEYLFYLTHMEYEESIDLATGKMKKIYCWFSRFRTYYD
jgi:hypothetical protein